MIDTATAIGAVAAICTSLSYFPQLKKCWETGETSDLSLDMFLTLLGGLSLWVVYGAIKGDAVVMIANCVSVSLLLGILYFKVRNMLRSSREA
jgi:MtN3 and saliva related transmembrane protein